MNSLPLTLLLFISSFSFMHLKSTMYSIDNKIKNLRVVHTRALRIWMENFFFDFNFFLSKISRSDRGSNLRSFDFELFFTRLLKPLSYRANQNNSKTNRFYTKQICVGFFHFALFVISCIVKIEFNSF